MKNRYLLATLAMYLLSFIPAKAQTYTSGNLTVSIVNDTMFHDSSYCACYNDIYYAVTKTGSFMGDVIQFIDTSGGYLIQTDTNTTGASTWTSYNFYQHFIVADLQLVGGVAHFNWSNYKFVSGADTVFIPNLADSFYVASPCQYSTITGRLYADINGNCTYDTSESWLAGVTPSLYENLASPSAWYGGGLSVDGYSGYTMTAQQSWLINGTVSLDSSYSFIFPSTCFIGPYTFTTLPQTNFDFPLQCSGNLDVQCWAGNPGFARPARPLLMQPYVSNLGCDAVSGTLTFVKDSRVAYDASLSAYPADTVRGDTLIWNYTNISSLSAGVYWNSFMSDLHLMPDSSVTIGDTLCFHIYTQVPAADINPANNDMMICIPVVTSYDPNEKDVEPKGDGPTGDIPSLTDELTYTIHFQNTGMAEAIDIHITDTLDSHIDPSSLKILGASHLMNPRWHAGNVVDFQFPNIWLADSFHNEPASHGYVRFKVKLNTHTPGTQIKNKGYIYFDTNPAVITNEALNTLVHTTGVATVPVKAVKVYPNPATDNITIENLQDGQLTIVNMNGAVVLQHDITATKTDINISRLPAGVYVLKTTNKDGTANTKFVKQ